MHSGQTAESGKKTIRSWLMGLTGKQWIIVLFLGLLLAVAAWPVSDKSHTVSQSISQSDSSPSVSVEQTELEKKMEVLLESVEGVGDVQVLLMTGSDENTQSFYGTEETKVTGVLIAAEGADQPVVVQNIQQAVMALFQIEAHKIKIMKMK